MPSSSKIECIALYVLVLTIRLLFTTCCFFVVFVVVFSLFSFFGTIVVVFPLLFPYYCFVYASHYYVVGTLFLYLVFLYGCEIT